MMGKRGPVGEFCSKSCRLAHRHREKSKMRECGHSACTLPAAFGSSYCSHKCRDRSESKCAGCNNYARKGQKFCSRECVWESQLRGLYRRNPSDKSYRSRAQRFGVAYELVKCNEVFERDGWTCGICRELVDKSLRYPDPMSVSLDHIVPLCAGGGHIYSNVQCSHLICNLRKNDNGMRGQWVA